MVLDAIEQAIGTREQDGVMDLKDVVHHTDRGVSIRLSGSPSVSPRLAFDHVWVASVAHRPLYEYCGDITPAQLEAAYYAQQRMPAAG